MTQPRSWPGASAVAVVFQLMLESWSPPRVESGYHLGPDTSREEVHEARPDLSSLSWQGYGGRAGFYRLMDVTDDHGVPATGVFSGLAVEQYPDVAKEFAQHGNELVAHGWSQEVRVFRLTDDQMREEIQRSIEIIRRVTGYAPVGWMSPGGQAGPNTLRLLAEAGFSYFIDVADDDTPYVVRDYERRLVAIPIAPDVSDHQIYLRGLNPPSAYVDAFRRSLDVLLREGRDGSPRVMSAVFNAALYGHPFGAWALRECVRYAKSVPAVWITTHRAVAEYWLEHTTGEVTPTRHPS